MQLLVMGIGLFKSLLVFVHTPPSGTAVFLGKGGRGVPPQQHGGLPGEGLGVSLFGLPPTGSILTRPRQISDSTQELYLEYRLITIAPVSCVLSWLSA
jgi:hypothetical protein